MDGYGDNILEWVLVVTAAPEELHTHFCSERIEWAKMNTKFAIGIQTGQLNTICLFHILFARVNHMKSYQIVVHIGSFIDAGMAPGS